MDRKILYRGKRFSILGDSISTLEGYNPKDYNLFYQKKDYDKTGIKHAKDTWWGKVIDYFNGTLLVNNSWSGSWVAQFPGREYENVLFPSGCSDERTGGLHRKNKKPDVIIVYLGTNDWAFGVKPEAQGDKKATLGDLHVFSVAYNEMLRKLKRNYPGAEIWCCSLCATYMKERLSFQFSERYGGVDVNTTNQIIRETAEKNECRFIDLYHYGIPYESIDGTHPNAKGMETIAKLIVKEMIKENSC